MSTTKAARIPLLRKTTMDETIDEGLNFLNSGCRTYGDEPVGRKRTTRSTLARSPSPKRTRKSPERFSESQEVPTSTKRSTSRSPPPRRTKKSPKSAKVSPTKKSSAPKKATPKPACIIKSAPRKASSRKSASPPIPALNYTNLDELRRTRKMKSTGEDNRITEIVFSFDTTGSMGQALVETQKKIVEITTRLFETVTGLRVGVITHNDYCAGGDSVMRVKPLGEDRQEIVDWVNEAKAGRGGDLPENYEEMLEYCNEHMNWTPGSHRVLVVIGDSLPHEPDVTLAQMKMYNRPNPREIDWREQLDKCWENGIKVYGVEAKSRASWNTCEVKYFYEACAAYTCGTHVQLSDFSAVTDMLLMVCFRESDRMAFDSFREELTREGRMNPAREAMFAEVSR